MSVRMVVIKKSINNNCFEGSEVKASACNAGDLGSISRREDYLEKEMATHYSTLAWRIP